MKYIEQNRDFKGVWIPKELWLNENLTMLEKIILVEIDSLDNEDHCIAGNEYLAEFCQCSEWKVSNAIKKLEELGYIEVISFDGRHRKIKSYMWKLQQPVENTDIDSNEPNSEDKEEVKEEAPKKASGRKSRKDQLTEFVNEKSGFKDETKEILLKWIFQVGIKGGVTVQQLQDMLRDIWTKTGGNEDLVREAISQAYLRNWFGFYYNQPKPGYKAAVGRTTQLIPQEKYKDRKVELSADVF